MRYDTKFLSHIFPGIRNPGWQGNDDSLHSRMPGVDPIYRWLQQQLEVGYDRSTRYQEFEEMDERSVEISAGLDYYADDATQFDREHKAVVWVESDDTQIESLGMELFKVRLQSDTNTRPIARNCAKMGDEAWRLYVDYAEPTAKSRGVTGWLPAPIKQIRRVEDAKGQLMGWMRDSFAASGSMPSASSMMEPSRDPQRIFNPWDFVHFRIRASIGYDFNAMYGQSMLKSARPVWKRLDLLEQALSLYRVLKSPNRNVFYVDVTELAHERALQVVAEWKSVLKRQRYINPVTGEMKQSLNPHSFEEDMVWPVRKDTNTRVDQLQGNADVISIADVEYFRSKMFLALMIPREYLTGEGSAVIQIGGGQSLAQKDIRYARTVSRLQRAIVEGYTRALQIHLALMEIDPSSERFRVMMAPISTLDEQQKLEALSVKIGVATQFLQLAMTLGVDPTAVKTYIFKELLGLSGAYTDAFLAPPPPPPGAPGAPPAAPPAKPAAQEDLARFKQTLVEDAGARNRVLDLAKKFRDTLSVVDYGPVSDSSPLPKNAGWKRPSDEEMERLAEAAHHPSISDKPKGSNSKARLHLTDP